MSSRMSIPLALAAVVAASLFYVAIQVALTKRRLTRLFQDRTPEAALETCHVALSRYGRERVTLAYRWVQDLVPYENPPIQANDDLWTDLLLDQGNVDDRFEASHDWLGDEAAQPPGPAPNPPRTVADLMREVLHYGYEGYAAVPKREAKTGKT